MDSHVLDSEYMYMYNVMSVLDSEYMYMYNVMSVLDSEYNVMSVTLCIDTLTSTLFLSLFFTLTFQSSQTNCESKT